MAWTVPERAEFAALKRHALCRALGGGDVTKGLHRLLLAERRVEQYLDREHRNEQSAPRPVCGNAAASPTWSAAATGAGMTKETAQRRRRPASAARKARSSARLQEFLAAKEGERHIDASFASCLVFAPRSIPPLPCRHVHLMRSTEHGLPARPAMLRARCRRARPLRAP